MLVESPGAKLDTGAYTVIAALFDSVMGRYPAIAANGVLSPPPNTGDSDDVSDAYRFSSPTTFVATPCPRFPLSLEVSFFDLLCPTDMDIVFIILICVSLLNCSYYCPLIVLLLVILIMTL